MRKQKIDYWDLSELDRLVYANMHEAVEDVLRKHEEDSTTPPVLTLMGFAKLKPNVKSEAARILNILLYYLDRDFRFYADNNTEPTERMKQAAEKFVKAVLKDFEVFDCKSVCVKKVNIKRWITKHPDWEEYEEKCKRFYE